MLIWLLSAGNFVVGMGAFVVVGLLPPIASGFGIGADQAGWLMTAYALAYAIGSPLGVALTGRLPRRWLMSAALGGFGAAAALSALAPSFDTLLAARVLAALSAGLFTPIAAAVAAAQAPPAARGRILARVFFGLTLAQVLGVPTGAYVAHVAGWRAAFALVALLAIPLSLALWRRIPADLAFQPTALRALAAALSDGRAMLAVSFTAFFMAAIYTLYTYLAPLLQAGMGFDGATVSLALLIFGFGAVAGNLLGGVLGDRLGPARTLTLLAGTQVVLMPTFALLPLPLTALWALLFLWSVFGWSFMAPQQMRLIALAPERQAVLLALNAAAIYVGAAIGGAVGGWTLGGAGALALGPVAGALGLIPLGVLWASARLEFAIDKAHLSR
ncbi:MAG: MFS transporter [Pseudomonadota bacterium]